MTDDDAEQQPFEFFEGVQGSTFVDLSSRSARSSLKIDPERIPLPVDTGSVAAVLRAGAPLNAEQCAFLLEALRSPAERRSKQRRERDAALCAAFALFEGSPSGRAKQLQQEFGRYLTDGWPREKNLCELPATTSEKRRALHRAARLAGGRALSWRHLLSIFERNAAE